MPSRFLCTLGTGLDAVHRTGAGDQHTVYWDAAWDYLGMRDEWMSRMLV